MYGGRKRCVVDQEGNIQYFLTGEEDPDTLINKRIMVYQPAFYYQSFSYIGFHIILYASHFYALYIDTCFLLNRRTI